ncbi:right-handed parallel beta-helix repeat-containing protein [Flavihumibacter petaseus]|uniref:Uncharacterized protein n=1 Tax=Flavihumibacter petaseus NBRC 106054 TaxID=1220578 RepID=A0A0E9N148_9BACT|nr:right-handed parallel beta-helix repeat-containing protein [Flavihumibacter petaseus]GAO43075.1 hypothetical protein FPE01S_02_01800 [Flavihumibacter petaseus NBRC 106054]
MTVFCKLPGILLAVMVAACSKSTTPTTPPLPAASNVYYVSNEGSDIAPGSAGAPLRSINTALGKALPGDTVLVRGGVYHEKVSFPKSGKTDKLITLKAFPGETVRIDGTGLSIIGKEALVTLRNVRFVVLEGFDVFNYTSSAPWVNINGIVASDGSSDIVIRKNRIYNIEHNVAPADGRSGHAIEIIGNTAVPMTNILVEENEIHDCNTGYSENLTINGYVDGFVIRKNKIYNAENIGIDAAGGYAANPVPAFNYARNGLIAENELFRIDMTTGPIGGVHGHGAIGIYVDGARNITVERNRVYDTDRGIGIVSENDAFPTSNCIVRNNFVYNCWRAGIYLGGYLNYTTGGTRNCTVANNTLFQNNREKGAFGEIEGEIRLTENCFDNTIVNNIIYARPEDVFVHKYTATGSNNTIDHNLYFTTGTATWIWNGKPLSSFDEWKKACGGDAASSAAEDPLLISIQLPDLHLQPASPAKNSGILLSGDLLGQSDIDGNSRVVNNKVSKGAQQ